jgi:hypothetical protein
MHELLLTAVTTMHLLHHAAPASPDCAFLSQGLQWYTAGLQLDEDGDAAHEFITADEVHENTADVHQPQTTQQQQQVRSDLVIAHLLIDFQYALCIGVCAT